MIERDVLRVVVTSGAFTSENSGGIDPARVPDWESEVNVRSIRLFRVREVGGLGNVTLHMFTEEIFSTKKSSRPKIITSFQSWHVNRSVGV